MVPVAPFITGINIVFIFHTPSISIARSSYFRNFWAYFLTTFLFPEISMYIDRHVPFSLSWNPFVRFIVRDGSISLNF
jgi:hypothetical protein